MASISRLASAFLLVAFGCGGGMPSKKPPAPPEEEKSRHRPQRPVRSIPMQPPFWTRVGFAWVVAMAILLLATLALYAATLYAKLNVPPLKRAPPEIALSVIFLVMAMVLVCAAIAVPLVIRRKAERRLGSPRTT